MVSQEEFLEMLEDIADEMPREFFNGLNNGILLKREARMHPESDPWMVLWIMGEYQISPTLGRSICIYYGSFEVMCKDLDKEELRKKVRHTVLHEFRHHLESMAGENGLVVEDAERMAGFRRGSCLL